MEFKYKEIVCYNFNIPFIFQWKQYNLMKNV